MFDIGFFELILIAIVVLVIVGPERMPGFARKTGRLLGRFKRALSDVKQEINNEIKAEELQEILNRQAQVPGMEEITDISQPASSQPTETIAKLDESKPLPTHDPAKY